ncbi:MAG: GntR family transcriptional regulator [Actinomycetota bacterium]|nr:GntR family transcriptional regulator [Actinomycetota bacterium]
MRATIAQPLWAQVLADLRLRLHAGEFAERFPGDHELVAHYGVSRYTIREAVRRLQADGILERRRGLGSFVNRAMIEQPIGKPMSLYRSVDCVGGQESIVRALELHEDNVAAEKLDCPGETLVYLERLRLVDGEPLALDRSWLPAARASCLLAVDFRHASLCDELATRCGVATTNGWERIHPVLPGPEECELLQIGARDPAFGIERLTFSGSEPLELRYSVVRGNQFTFIARWSEERTATAID